MNILENKSDEEIVASLLSESAKAKNELKCAKADIEKAESRLSFCLVLINTLIERIRSNNFNR